MKAADKLACYKMSILFILNFFYDLELLDQLFEWFLLLNNHAKKKTSLLLINSY